MPTGGVTPAGGGSAPVIARQVFHDVTGVSIANGSGARLPFAIDDGPNLLLDVTVNTTPTVITGGVYAVAVDAAPFAAMTANGTFALRLVLDASNEAPQVNATNIAVAGFLTPELSLAMTYYLPAGAQLYAQVVNRDGVAARTFGLNQAIVQRLS